MSTDTGLTRADLERKGRILFRRDGKQVLLLAQEGRIFAIANRCPHEGYPLSEGSLGPGCVLTCNWHNWKFDLASGRALVGRDPVRTYPVSQREGRILVDLADPPADAQRARALAGIEAAMSDFDADRMAREAARLERAGFDASEALAHAVAISAARFEYGMTHAFGAAPDWLMLAGRARNEAERLAATIEPIAHIAWDIRGEPERPFAEARAPWDEQAFLAAVEAEDEERAVAHIRGAREAGLGFAELRPALARAALAHYLSFGHAPIYVTKVGALVERLGPETLEPLLFSLARMIVMGTREERIPEFRAYAKALAEWDTGGGDPIRGDELYSLPVEGLLARLLASAKREPAEILDALLGAAAWNLVHFDLEVDRATDNPIHDNVSWLDFTHALTFASAARELCEETPELWPQALLQLGLFAGRNAKYLDAGLDAGEWRVGDPAAFLAREMRALFDHGIAEPIIACHRLKVLFALERELALRPDAPWGPDMLAGVNRYLHTPIKRRHGLRMAAQALDFIAREG